MVDRLLTGLAAQQKGTTARWYSNKTSLCMNIWLDFCHDHEDLNNTPRKNDFFGFCLNISIELCQHSSAFNMSNI